MNNQTILRTSIPNMTAHHFAVAIDNKLIAAAIESRQHVVVASKDNTKLLVGVTQVITPHGDVSVSENTVVLMQNEEQTEVTTQFAITKPAEGSPPDEVVYAFPPCVIPITSVETVHYFGFLKKLKVAYVKETARVFKATYSVMAYKHQEQPLPSRLPESMSGIEFPKKFANSIVINPPDSLTRIYTRFHSY